MNKITVEVDISVIHAFKALIEANNSYVEFLPVSNVDMDKKISLIKLNQKAIDMADRILEKSNG